MYHYWPRNREQVMHPTGRRRFAPHQERVDVAQITAWVTTDLEHFSAAMNAFIRERLLGGVN